ncbi:MAG: hypothetical protein WC755_08650 [Candidatus Woesearchaeota archaeon]
MEFIHICLGGRMSSFNLSHIMIASSGLQLVVFNIFLKKEISGLITQTSNEKRG